MHPSEIEAAMKTMVIWTDSREQPTVQAQRRYEQFGVPHERRKLDFGDYTAAFTLPDGSVFLWRTLP